MRTTRNTRRASRTRRSLSAFGTALVCVFLVSVFVFAFSQTGPESVLPEAMPPSQSSAAIQQETTVEQHASAHTFADAAAANATDSNAHNDSTNSTLVHNEASADTSDAANEEAETSLANHYEDTSIGGNLDTLLSSQSTESETIPSVADIPDSDIHEIAAEHDSNTVVVQIDPSASAMSINAALAQADGVARASITQEDIARGFAEIEVAEGVEAERTLAQLETIPEVASAQPNFIYHALETDTPDAEDDANTNTEELQEPTEDGKPALSLQLPESDTVDNPGEQTTSYNLNEQAVQLNDRQASSQWMLDAIDVRDAWSTTRVEGAVTVAVIDDGCRVTHEDLEDNIVATYNAVTNSTSIDPGDHGTHVCGIVAAEANNHKGVAGVSYNANLLPIQVFDGSGDASSYTIARAYDYITQNRNKHNIKVVNMSLGTTMEGITSKAQAYLDFYDNVLVNRVQTAHRQYGILTVLASGNDADTTGGAYFNYPSDWLDDSIGVIALKNNPIQRASYSNYNLPIQTTKDIAAPGSNIYSTYYVSDYAYNYKSGTSMASPCVAGVAALVYAANPKLSASGVADILCSTATDLGTTGWDTQYGHGVVNAMRAVELASHGLTIEGESALFAGETIALKTLQTQPVTWETSDASIATVSASGVVSGKKPGVVLITARATNEISITREITVYQASFSGATSIKAGTDANISFAVAPTQGTWNFSVSNSAIASIESTTNNKLVVRGKSLGTTTIMARKGNLVRTHTLTVTPNNIAQASVSGLSTEWYTGSAITPQPTIKAGSNTLTRGTDYTLSYKNNVSAGTATVTITGKGNYTGTKVATFTIVKRPTWAGATRLPVYASATYAVSNGSIKIISGSAYIGLSEKTITAKKAGTATLGLYDSLGRIYAKRTIKVFTLSGRYVLQSAASSNLILALKGKSKTNGATAYALKRNANNAQTFRFSVQKGRTYAIVSTSTGKCLSVKSPISRQNGARIVQWTWNNTTNQRWRILVDSSNRLTFVSERSGKAIYISGGKAAADKRLVQNTPKGETVEKWVLKR